MNIALVLAGGTGNRMQSDKPKQLMQLNGEPVICYSVAAFQVHSQIDAIFVVCNMNCKNEYDFLFSAEYGFSKLQPLVIGGETRKQSSLQGLLEIKKRFSGDSCVLIHDAARPFVTQDIISENIVAVCKYGACTTAIPVTDTLLLSDDGTEFCGVTNRSVQYLAQTPQSFRLDTIIDAHQSSSDEATDDTSLLIQLGVKVQMVLGEKRNLKLTTSEDFMIAQAYLS